MSAAWQAVFYGVAVLCFLVAAFRSGFNRNVNLVALGLALAFFVPFFINFKAA